MKETVIQFNLCLVLVSPVPLETANDRMKVSLRYEVLVLGFLWFLFAKGHALSSVSPSASIIMWCCVVDVWASAFNPVVISLTACLFDLTFFHFLGGASTVLHFFTGAAWLTWFSSVLSRFLALVRPNNTQRHWQGWLKHDQISYFL